MWRLWSLPLRLIVWPVPLVFGCLALLSFPLIAEYAGARETLADGRERQRTFPLREWFVCYMRMMFPELTVADKDRIR